MRVCRYEGDGVLTVVDVEPPPLGPHDVRVQVVAAGICGSDVHGYRGDNGRRAPGTVMGHEVVGRIVERGTEVPLGPDLVAVNPVRTCGACPACWGQRDNLCSTRRLQGCVPELPGGLADSLVLPAANAVALTGGVPPEWGALVEPLSVGAHAVRIAGPAAGAATLVIGGGPIGLGVALAARRVGADVVLAEPAADRRAVAARLGLAALDPTEVQPAQAELAFDCVGLAASANSALTATVAGGTVVLVGLGPESIPLSTPPLVMGERVLRGSAVYTAADFRDTATWVGAGEVDLAPLIQRRCVLEELPAVFAQLAAGRDSALRVVLRHHPS